MGLLMRYVVVVVGGGVVVVWGRRFNRVWLELF
jgi:hypothetical protein